MRLKTKQSLMLALIVALQLAASSCSLSKSKEMGQHAVDQFHRQFNAGQYHEIYVQSDEGFQKSSSEADTVALFGAIRRKLGTVKTANQTSWHVNTTTTGTVITLAYDVDFTEGKGTEQFVLKMKGDKALLFNYNVNSPLLITK
ncbi:MAG: hypothetical protein ACRD8U_18595 [Pyrinomonadaceae bacterium]